ncbi:MAG: hypothetical protein RLZZ572_154, partial [Pseudomonadota bacterium]
MDLLTYHCCHMEIMLFTTQYKTKPAGKKKKNTLNTTGIQVM